MDKDFWNAVRVSERGGSKSRKIGAINLALLFGTAAIAISLVVTPMLAGHNKPQKSIAYTAEPYDDITTGSITQTDGTKRYTIRRSVLQETPGSVCIVEDYESAVNCR